VNVVKGGDCAFTRYFCRCHPVCLCAVAWCHNDNDVITSPTHCLLSVTSPPGTLTATAASDIHHVSKNCLHATSQRSLTWLTSFGQLTLMLLLHYIVKFRSRSLAVYNNEFILRSTCVGSEMINWIVTNMSNSYYLSKSHLCHITSSFLQHMLKMSSSSMNTSGTWRNSPAGCSITARVRAAICCWCIISVRWWIT